jgi:hypothetical protein
MEFLSQYDHTIIYIKGEDNMVADALSHLSNDIDITALPPIATILAIWTDTSLLKSIIDRYETDPFCIKLKNAEKSIEGVHWADGLLYVRDHLVIPRMGTLREDLFYLTHDSLGHFGFNKSYATIRDTYYCGRTSIETSTMPTSPHVRNANETKAAPPSLLAHCTPCQSLTNVGIPLPSTSSVHALKTTASTPLSPSQIS